MLRQCPSNQKGWLALALQMIGVLDEPPYSILKEYTTTGCTKDKVMLALFLKYLDFEIPYKFPGGVNVVTYESIFEKLTEFSFQARYLEVHDAVSASWDYLMIYLYGYQQFKERKLDNNLGFRFGEVKESFLALLSNDIPKNSITYSKLERGRSVYMDLTGDFKSVLESLVVRERKRASVIDKRIIHLDLSPFKFSVSPRVNTTGSIIWSHDEEKSAKITAILSPLRDFYNRGIHKQLMLNETGYALMDPNFYGNELQLDLTTYVDGTVKYKALPKDGIITTVERGGFYDKAIDAIRNYDYRTDPKGTAPITWTVDRSSGYMIEKKYVHELDEPFVLYSPIEQTDNESFKFVDDSTINKATIAKPVPEWYWLDSLTPVYVSFFKKVVKTGIQLFAQGPMYTDFKLLLTSADENFAYKLAAAMGWRPYNDETFVRIMIRAKISASLNAIAFIDKKSADTFITSYTTDIEDELYYDEVSQ
jgi:hypothetical protein